MPSAVLRALVTSSGWPPGTIPRPIPLVIAGSPACSTSCRAASSAPSDQTSPPRTSTGRSADESSDATRSRASGSGSTRAGGAYAGRATVLVAKKTSSGTSTKAGPRCGVRARVNASSTAEATSSGAWTVRADFVTGASSGTWSSSWRLPLPHRLSGARPPRTTSGEPLNHAWVRGLTPLVTPGPAVRTARPGTRVSLPSASAANTAVCSWRTSRSRTGGSAFTAPSYTGKTWAPDSVKSVWTPWACATATACAPEWASTGGEPGARSVMPVNLPSATSGRGAP